MRKLESNMTLASMLSFTLSCGLFGCGGASGPETSNGAMRPIINSEAAASARALAIMGMKEARVAQIQPSEVSVPFDIPPGALWRVRMDAIDLAWKDQFGQHSNPYVKSLDVILSSYGHPIEIMSQTPASYQVPPFPNASNYKSQLEARINETYTDKTNADPRISVSMAIEKSMGSDIAKQIIIYCVDITTTQWKSPRTAWVVHAWDVPAWMPIGTPPGYVVPKDDWERLRTIVDANTGEVEGSDTFPFSK
jgi:hypothetical protein